MNQALFLAINGLAGQNPWLDGVMIALATAGPFVMFGAVLALGIAGMVRHRDDRARWAVHTLVFMGINLVLSMAIGFIHYSPRPFVNQTVNQLVPHSADSGLPSDHATGSMALAVGSWDLSRWMGAAMTVLAVLVGLARVYVGVHYPADILAAWLLVGLSSLVYRRFLSGWVDWLIDGAAAVWALFKLGRSRSM